MRKLFVIIFCLFSFSTSGCSSNINENYIKEKCSEYLEKIDSSEEFDFSLSNVTLKKESIYSCEIVGSSNKSDVSISLEYDKDGHFNGFMIKSENIEKGDMIDLSAFAMLITSNKELKLEEDFKTNIKDKMMDHLYKNNNVISEETENYQFSFVYDNSYYLMFLYNK